MFSIESCPLPDGALLGAYVRAGAYTDCYATDVPDAVSHQQYVAAFYTTWVFKLERLILKWAISKPSTDDQARALAAGTLDAFAAWKVEGRSADQLLLSDMFGSTRSWLMVAALTDASGPRTRLYFGSAVVASRMSRSGKPAMALNFRVLLGFHKLYSQMLLRAARSRLT
jgi:hypothetical protein